MNGKDLISRQGNTEFRLKSAWRDIWFWSALATMLWAVITIVVRVYSARELQFDMDEVVHALPGQLYLAAQRTGDPSAFWRLLTRPEWYPPLDGLLRSVWYALLGSSTVTARLFTAFFFAAVGLILWLTSLELCPGRSRGFAFFPILALAMDPLHSGNAGLAMLEIPALFWSLLALYLNTCAALKERPRLALVSSSFAGLASFFTRYDYGIVTLTAIAASHLIELIQSRAQPYFRNRLINLALFAVPAVIIIPAWLLGSGQIKWLYAWERWQSQPVTSLFGANLTFYPKLLLDGPFTGAATIGLLSSFGWCASRHQFALRTLPYLLFLVIGLFVVTYYSLQNESRYGMMFISTVWLLASVYLAHCNPSWGRNYQNSIRSVVAIALPPALVGFLLFPGPKEFRNIYENTNAEVTRAYDYVGDVTQPWNRQLTRIVMFGRSDQQPGRALEFHLVSACERRSHPCDVEVLDERELKYGWPRGSVPAETYATRCDEALEIANYVVVFGPPPSLLKGWRVISQASYTPEVEGVARPLKLIILVR